jgi:Ca-activated chloride channel family protein
MACLPPACGWFLLVAAVVGAPSAAAWQDAGSAGVPFTEAEGLRPTGPSSAASDTTDSAEPLAPPAWEALLADRDASPERLYNEGVARFRASEFDAAGTLFASAAARAKASLSSRAMYNRGTTSLADAVRAMQASASPSPQGDGADARTQAMETLQRSLRELKDAVRADPTDRDARANAELAHRVLKELQQQQQDQQQQDQQSQDQQNQDQQNQDQQNQDQQNQDQQNQDQQNQDQQNQDQQNQDQQNQDQQNQDQQNQDQQNQDQQNQDQQNQDQQNQEQQNQEQQNQEQQNQDQQEARKPLSKQDIERLLQRIRDRERARVREVLDRERARTKPAPKDW